MLQLSFIVFGFILVWFVLTQRGHRAVYAFVVAWVLFPNRADNLLGVGGVPLFVFLEFVLAIALWVRIYLDRPAINTAIAEERWLLGLFWITLVVQYAVGLPAVEILFPNDRELLQIDRVAGFGHAFAALTFLTACSRFIIHERQVIRFVELFYYAGIAVGLELLAVLFVPPFTSLVGLFTLKEAAGFQSVMLNDPFAVSLMCGVGGIASMFLWWSRGKRLRYAIGGGIAILPLIFNIGLRSALLACFVAGVYFVVANLSRGQAMLVGLAGALAGLAIILNLPLLIEATDRVIVLAAGTANSEVSSKIVMSILKTESLLARLGIQARALEVLYAVMPFGVGEGALRHFVGMPEFAIDYRPFGQVHPDLALGYFRVASGLKATESHNAYLDVVASYGVLGLISMIALIGLLLRNWWTIRKTFRRGEFALLWKALFAMLLLFGVAYSFESYPRIYPIYFVLIHGTFVVYRTSLYRLGMARGQYGALAKPVVV